VPGRGTLVLDVALVTAWVHATGGGDSEFRTLYLIVIVTVALRFGIWRRPAGCEGHHGFDGSARLACEPTLPLEGRPVSEGSIRERLSALSRAELIGLVALLGVTLGGAGLWYVRSLPKPVAITAGAAGGGEPAPAASASPPPAAVLLVDVAGWVRHPGVYEFEEGARVIDAIDAAGGARTGAMLESLNLAAPLTDGSQILVPKEGEQVATPPVAGESGAASGGLIDVNTAGATELEALPGVGEVIAQAIVDYRTENGPFTSVDQLLDVSGIGDATLEDIRELVTV
jgi:competence protein ComEA